MKKAFVTGWPISHSKSPMLHGFWIDHYGINASYEPLGVEPENFQKFLKDLPNSEFVGGNVTIPHKEIAFENLTKLDDAAKAIGAVNTLWIESEILCGGNTDAYGFSANLDEFAPEWRDGKTAMVLGAGGASRAIVHSLLEAGFEKILIVNRTYERAQKLANQFGDNCSAHNWADLPDLMPRTDLIVNTTSIGMAGTDASMMPDLSVLSDNTIVTDIVYSPLETPFLKSANERGLKTVDGLGMLLHQAVPGFEKWFGIRPDVTPQLRKLILELSA